MLAVATGVRAFVARFLRLLGTTQRDDTRRRVLVRWLRRLGLEAAEKSGASLEDVAATLRQGRPVVVNYREPEADESRFAVVVGLTPSSVVMNGPWHGPRFAMPRKESVRRWYGKHRTVGIRWLTSPGK